MRTTGSLGQILFLFVLTGTVIQTAPSEALCLFPAGDVDGSGKAIVTDVKCVILSSLFTLIVGGNSDANPSGSPTCLGDAVYPAYLQADLNCDRRIDVSDIQISIRHALSMSLDSQIDQNQDDCVDRCQTDSDGDGDLDFSDCAPLDPSVHRGAAEVCNGYDDNCNGAIDEEPDPELPSSCDDANVCTGIEFCTPPTSTGAVVISEVLYDPEAVDDEFGEWIEILNGTTGTVDLNFWAITDESGDYHQINFGSVLLVPAGGRIVLARQGEPSLNGGVVATYVYDNFELDNSSDAVVLLNAAGLEIDRLEYGPETGLPPAPGASLARENPSVDEPNSAGWAVALSEFGAGDAATPGGPNSDVVAGGCDSTPPLDCYDPSECISAQCHPTFGCQTLPESAGCDDGSVCTYDCSAEGTCFHVETVCDDAVDCTVDSCDPVAGCIHVASDALCDDGIETTLDLCDPESGCYQTCGFGIHALIGVQWDGDLVLLGLNGCEFPLETSVPWGADALARGSDGTLYVGGHSGLYEIDPLTGFSQWLSDFDGDGLAILPDGNFYVSDTKLKLLDIDSGTHTEIGEFGDNELLIRGMETGPDGVLYGTNSGQLYLIDSDCAEAVPVPEQSLFLSFSIAYLPNGALYMAGRVLSEFGYQQSVYARVDPETGAVLEGPWLLSSSIHGLEYIQLSL